MIILASASATRRSLLEKAGVPFAVDASPVDEAALKNEGREKGWTVEETALVLAEAKARAVAPRHKGLPVLGADQMLDCEGRWLDKAHNRAEAEEQLRFLSGKTHRLISAVALVKDDAVLWRYIEEARLTIRPLSETAITAYCDALGDALLGTVGCYALEGRGIQLFEKVEGDFFTILGLPLLALLRVLREKGVCPV